MFLADGLAYDGRAPDQVSMTVTQAPLITARPIAPAPTGNFNPGVYSNWGAMDSVMEPNNMKPPELCVVAN
jgi:hypothetical protein